MPSEAASLSCGVRWWPGEKTEGIEKGSQNANVYMCLHFPQHSLSSPKDMLIDFRERGKVGERDRSINMREKHWSAASAERVSFHYTGWPTEPHARAPFTQRFHSHCANRGGGNYLLSPFFKINLLIMLLQLPHFPPSLHSILPTPSLPHSPPIVHVHGSYL